MEFKCGSWKVMKNKITWAVLHLQTKEKGKKFPLGLKFECQPLIHLADFLSHDLNEQKYLLSYPIYCCSRVLHNNEA